MANEQRPLHERASVSGSLADLSLADLLQTLEIGHKSGTVRLETPDGRTGTIWLRKGAVIDAVAGARRGEAAFHWSLKWRDGRFSIQFDPTDRPGRIQTPTQHLLMDGMRRLDEWSHAIEELPPLHSVLQIDYLLLSERLADVPEPVNALLKLVDGRRTIAQVLDQSEAEDIETLHALAGMLREEIVRVRAPPPETPPPLPQPPRAGSASGPPPPRIVRFSREPRSAIEVAPVTVARRRDRPPPLRPRPPASRPVHVADLPAPSRRTGNRGAWILLLAALAAGIAAWWFLERPRVTAPGARPTAALRRAMGLDPASAPAYIAVARIAAP